jgi:phosphatidyl-myo-inositol dimannoside synthase
MPKVARCLALVTEAFGGNGGIAQYNCDYLQSLATSGFFTSIIVLPRYGSVRSDPSPMITQLSPRRGRMLYVLAALRTAFTRRAEVVFCGHIYMVVLALFIARLTRAKLVVQMHGIEAWCRPTPLRRYAVEAADLVLCVSRYTRAAVLDWAAIAPERVLVLPNTVREIFSPGDRSKLRAELGLSRKQVLLTVGRMDDRERYKGHDRVIAAIPRLVAEGHDIAYVVAGAGSDSARLMAIAVELGVADRVIFLGSIESQQLVDVYRMADLFVMPSTGEGFGIAFVEAMACGTRAIGLEAGGAIDALGDGELGTVTSEAEFTAAIASLLDAANSDPASLAAAIRARFGRAAFAENVRASIPRLIKDTRVGCEASIDLR